MFVIAGLSGNTGSAAGEALLRDGHKITGLTRDPERLRPWAEQGVSVAEAEFTDADALTRAFEGAEGAYMLAPPDLQHPDPIALYAATATAIAKAARATGLPRLVFLSSYAAHLPAGTGPIRGMHAAESILAGACPVTVFLRPSSFIENWRSVIGPARDAGVLPTFLRDLGRKGHTVSTHDIGVMAASLLRDASPPKVVELTGPQDYSVEDVARTLTSVLGRPVAPVQPPREAWEGILQQSGVGAAYAALLAEMYDGLNSGLVQPEGTGDQRRGRRSLDETVRSWNLS